MNCRRIQDLIPLCAGGDLEEGRAREVSRHIETCDECRLMFDQFSESRDWARSAAEPDFDEAFFDDLRQNVLAEIESVKSRPSFFRFLKERMTPGLALAATVALMVILVGVAFYIYSDRAKNDSSSSHLAEEKKEEQTAPIPQQEESVEKQRVPRHRPRQRNALAKRVKEIASPVKSTIEQPVISENRDRVFPDLNGENRTTGGMTRIEFQTADPNIRIIWFAPKEADSKPPKPVTD